MKLDSDGALTVGKYSGKNVEEVAKDDPAYLRWVLDNIEDLGDEDRETIELLLKYRIAW